MHPARTLPKFRSAVAFALAAVLLFAQWSGLAHRIDHAPLAVIHAQSDLSDDHDTEPNHSCVAFDAAAVADAIHLPPFVAPLLASTHVLALWVAFNSWDAPLVRHFSSRAPPLS
jgi:hypothetical protein